eukprot:10122510-Lingulodinium_polyedra.AAC.1
MRHGAGESKGPVPPVRASPPDDGCRGRRAPAMRPFCAPVTRGQVRGSGGCAAHVAALVGGDREFAPLGHRDSGP